MCAAQSLLPLLREIRLDAQRVKVAARGKALARDRVAPRRPMQFSQQGTGTPRVDGAGAAREQLLLPVRMAGPEKLHREPTRPLVARQHPRDRAGHHPGSVLEIRAFDAVP